jgi:hypothetical protein
MYNDIVKDSILRAIGMSVLVAGALSITLLPLYMLGQMHGRMQNKPPLPERLYR